MQEVIQHYEFQRQHQHMVLSLRLLIDLFVPDTRQLQFAYRDLIF